MAITWLIPRGKERFEPITNKSGLLRRFDSQLRVTIGTGITCAFLGDERNLREYLIAEDAAKALRHAGHIVTFYLFDDGLDPLAPRQLRVAVDKDPAKIEQYQHFCGMPIADIPSPHPDSRSWAEHFECLILRRLAQYDCYPNLQSTAHLYRLGAYDPFIHIVLERGNEIRRFLEREFPEYTPQALFHPICPACGRMKGASLTFAGRSECVVECETCRIASKLPAGKLRGKLNWKLDCAARWKLFNIDAEPFSKAYLEPGAGAFWISHAISKEFFDGPEVHPVLTGLVKVDPDLDPAALGALPASTLRTVYTERWNNDIHLTRERVLLAASKPDKPGETSYLERMRREMPHLRVRLGDLSSEEYTFYRKGEIFQRTILNQEPESYESAARTISALPDRVLWGTRMILRDSVQVRQRDNEYVVFDAALRFSSEELGENRKAVHTAVRELLGHRKGLPLRRLLFSAPLTTLELLLLAIERTLEAHGATMQLAQERVSAAVTEDTASTRVTRLG